jgi:hypothetical protein
MLALISRSGADPPLAAAASAAAVVDTYADSCQQRLEVMGTKEAAEAVAPYTTNPTAAQQRARLHQQQTLKKNVEELGYGLASVDGWRVRAVGAFPTVRLAGCFLAAGEGRWYYEATLLTDGLMQIGWAASVPQTHSVAHGSDADTEITIDQAEELKKKEGSEKEEGIDNAAENKHDYEQVGGCSGFVCDPLDGTGCGDHFKSWAFDGFRQRRWCVSSSAYGERWRMGDVLGCLLDLNNLEVTFTLNGKDMGPAFTAPQVDPFYLPTKAAAAAVTAAATGSAGVSDADHGVKSSVSLPLAFYPCASMNVNQALKFNFGHSPFQHCPPPPPPTTSLRQEAPSTSTAVAAERATLAVGEPRDEVSSFSWHAVSEAPVWSDTTSSLLLASQNSMFLRSSGSSNGFSDVSTYTTTTSEQGEAAAGGRSGGGGENHASSRRRTRRFRRRHGAAPFSALVPVSGDGCPAGPFLPLDTGCGGGNGGVSIGGGSGDNGAPLVVGASLAHFSDGLHPVSQGGGGGRSLWLGSNVSLG